MSWTNYHSHTNYCDGTNTPEDYIRKALELEMPTYGFSSHAPIPFFDCKWAMKMDDLEGYCGETASALIQLAGLVLDTPAAMRASELAGHAGCAQAIAGLLRMLPIHRRRGQCYIPGDLLRAKNGLWAL